MQIKTPSPQGVLQIMAINTLNVSDPLISIMFKLLQIKVCLQ